MPKASNQLREFAIIGARARVKELREEIASIHRDFPELRASGGSGGVPSPFSKTPGQTEPSAHDGEDRPRRRRRMSAAARKKISDAQKKRWAKQRAAKK